MPRLFGLIGYPLGHSFSPGYFSRKFEREHIRDARYELFPLDGIERLPELLSEQPDLIGLNVTIPYKELVLPFLDRLHPNAKAIGAVNTIRIEAGQLTGYNTDVIGFEQSLLEWLGVHLPPKALVLGSGGSSKAVRHGLTKLGIGWTLVSRQAGQDVLTYGQLDDSVVAAHQLIINTTPLGMHPESHVRPDIPYHLLGSGHSLFDLIYNPEKTLFLETGEKQGARIQNGLRMLELQAEAAWSIWNGHSAEAT